MPIHAEENGLFRLDTARSSYWLRVTHFGHPEQLHYGRLLSGGDPEPLAQKSVLPFGSSVLYDESDPSYCLDSLPLDWSGVGRGDYRKSPCELKMPDGSFCCDFVYRSHEILPGCVAMDCLPTAYDGREQSGVETLALTLEDASNALTLVMYYTVFPTENVITRRCVLKNGSEGAVSIRKLMSFMIDLPDRNYTLHSFDGAWIREAHRHARRVEYGVYENSAATGASSNRHNPGFLLSAEGTNEDWGECWGFNLIYSGNHCGIVEKSPADLVRVQLGVNPACFDWTLRPGEAFETPEAVLSFSDRGLNGLSENFHSFVNNDIVRGDWKNAERPVLLNNWEAHFFKFTHGKLIRLARRAKSLGAELFVLDDGWFGERISDAAGLGDYTVNRRKLPRGLTGLSEAIRAMGLKFGLWFEPEMVNPDSDLYRAHPDWAVTTPGKKPCLGRNQLLLDLTRPEVRDYIVENVSRVIDEAQLSYVKWDMNRHMSDAYSPLLENQGEFAHRYILGLYELLHRIFDPRPHVLLESCSSGGNRFDLGMLCFSPQIWASDDTDPVERLEIQQGLSYLYPQSCMGAHVSAAPHQQTLRTTPLSTRFNVAAFGCLGYELDLKWLTAAEKREIREQIAFYKAHRKTLQYGPLRRFTPLKDNKYHWQVSGEGETVCGLFQTQVHAAEGNDILPVTGLEPEATYTVTSKRQYVYLKTLAGLVKHVLPVELKPDGFVLRTANKFYALTDGEERCTARGDALMAGLRLQQQFIGTGYDPKLRLPGDWGSTLYLIEKNKSQEDAT